MIGYVHQIARSKAGLHPGTNFGVDGRPFAVFLDEQQGVDVVAVKAHDSIKSSVAAMI